MTQCDWCVPRTAQKRPAGGWLCGLGRCLGVLTGVGAGWGLLCWNPEGGRCPWLRRVRDSLDTFLVVDAFALGEAVAVLGLVGARADFALGGVSVGFARGQRPTGSWGDWGRLLVPGVLSVGSRGEKGVSSSAESGLKWGESGCPLT
jgi:hypothetical protein